MLESLDIEGYGVGASAISFVVAFARDIGERVGCRYVSLDAQPELEEWYGEHGFVRNRLMQEQRVREAVLHRRDPARIAVSMRYDLRASG